VVSRSDVKRCKERCLDEAAQLLRQIPQTELVSLERNDLQLLVRLLISMQLQTVSISTACRKVDKVTLLQLPIFNQHLYYSACMFLEDSMVGREVWRESHQYLLSKVSELFPVVLQQESHRDGPMCYIAVKLCLQIFQLLSTELAPLVWDREHQSPAVQNILQALMDIILGQCSNRDTRLLAGTTLAMLINMGSERKDATAAAWSLLQVAELEPWLLTVGGLRIRCSPVPGGDTVGRLAVSRGLLTCCRPHVLLSSYEDCLLLKGLFPLVWALCEEKLECHYLAFEVLTLWLKRVKECLADIWKKRGVGLLSANSSLQQKLIDIVWTNAESPVYGVSEFVRCAFSLLLDIYKMDCENICDTEKTLYLCLLQRIIHLPWESKAKYYHLCSLLPYLGTDMVLDHYVDLPSHLLKCLSTNHLSPCGSELYKSLVQQQRRELENFKKSNNPTELDITHVWAKRWRPVLHEALTSDVTLLQNNSATHLLPCTFQVFPSAVTHLLASLDPLTPGHLHAWASIMSTYRATTGCSPWALQDSSIRQTLQLALGSADDKVRLAALNLLCCSPKTKDSPTTEEVTIMREFIPQNLNCESSPFRQHFQASVKKFLVRIRDGCLALVRGQKGKNKQENFVEWLSHLPYSYLAPGHSYQRKKTVLLLLSAVLDTCTDTWSPDKKKGQPPANIASLISCARQNGRWDFFNRAKQLVLISCLEDSTNEIRELSAGILLRFFPNSFPDDVGAVLLRRTKQLLSSPRVQEAQMGALMMKVLLLNSTDDVNSYEKSEASCRVRQLVKELQEHYHTAKADMMLAAKTKPIHGIVGALHRCVIESPLHICDTLDHSMVREVLLLLENISLLLLGVLFGDLSDAPPSFCDMGNAISSLIAQTSVGDRIHDDDDDDDEECVLLSEEHSLILTCCWVSLKDIGIFLGSLVEKLLTDSNKCILEKEDLIRTSIIFKNILLKCRHWGAVEGSCVGFTKFCASLRFTSFLSAGLPMLILCVVSAEEASKSRPLLARSMETLLDTAKMPLPDDWDQTLDLPQVCAVHTLQALVRGSGLGGAVLQFAPAVAILSLTLLSSPCWAMRNAALQLYSSLSSRMLGQRPSIEDSGPAQNSMSPSAFFLHYPGLQPFLLGELKGAAEVLEGHPDEAKLHLQPSLYPILTLLAQLQPGVQDSAMTLSDFLPPLVQLSTSPIYCVRVMVCKALVAMTPPTEYRNILIKLTAQLPRQQERCRHNQLHGQLMQIRAFVERTLSTDSASSSSLTDVVTKVEESLWLLTEAQRCPLVRAVYLEVAESLRGLCSETYLSYICDTLMHDLHTPQEGLQVGLSSFHQRAISFLCADPQWAHQVWDSFSAGSSDLKLSLVMWLVDGQRSQPSTLKEVIMSVLQLNLRETMLSHSIVYRRTFLTALALVMDEGDSTSIQQPAQTAALQEPVLSECLDLLLRDLEEVGSGPEFLSHVLCAASLLLSKGLDVKESMTLLWCNILECYRSPDAPEVLRLASADALCVAGVPLMSKNSNLILSRLINTGLYLLQDQNQQVRAKAAGFTSMLQHVRAREGRVSAYHMQVNQAVPSLLDLLLEEFSDLPETLEVLLSHLPQSDIKSIIRDATETGFSTLYEQDEANVFAEPSVMSAQVLPYLLQMTEKHPQSSALAQSLSMWVEQSAAHVCDCLELCKNLLPAESFTNTWLSLLLEPRFHSTLCGLFSKAAFLLRLLKNSNNAQSFCDPSSLHKSLQEVLFRLSQNGVYFPTVITAALAEVLPCD
uniref:Si:ch211-225b11.4 n=1 Tax=Cynoglossus semilaevis TaxID=244447 RepID=A0A3P8VX30_CYNSE